MYVCTYVCKTSWKNRLFVGPSSKIARVFLLLLVLDLRQEINISRETASNIKRREASMLAE